MLASLRWLGLLIASVVPVGTAPATSTDGFHSVQIVPIVVDTASFSSEIYVFNPHNPDFAATVFNFRYFPAQGTAHVGPLDCGNQTIANNSAAQYTLKTLCPGLAAGANFGHLGGTGVGRSEPPVQRVRPGQ